MFQKLIRNLERNLFGRDPHYQDPYGDPAEQFYARIYLKYLFERIDAEFRHQQVRILDVGCHTGRLSIPLARAGHHVTGIDSSRFHVKRAEAHARDAGVNCHFIRADGFRYLPRFRSGSFDMVLCTEVLYQRPDSHELMEALQQVLRNGGLLATSHRTRFFYLSQAIRERDFDTAQFIQNHNEGHLWGSYFNWQSSSELKTLYRELGMDLVMLRPVGVFTGNGGDGMAKLCDLSQTQNEEREALFDIEAGDSEEFADLGRFILAIGRKKE